MLRVTSYHPAGTPGDEPSGYVTLAHDQRHLRRKLLHLQNDEMVMLDLKEAVLFAHGDLLVVENGDLIEVRAAAAKLFEITPKDRLHLIELAWHLRNRPLSAQIAEERILILSDPVIRHMPEALSATVREMCEPFHPARGPHTAHGPPAHCPWSHCDRSASKTATSARSPWTCRPAEAGWRAR